jgi:hypothetical protein
MRLPACAPAVPSRSHPGVDGVQWEVGSTVAQHLWKRTWGGFVEGKDTRAMWWDEEKVVGECRGMGTGWTVGWVTFVKPK